MQKNGFYAAMKTDEGIQAVYIDEEACRARQVQAARESQARHRRVAQRRAIAAAARQNRATLRVVKQELKLLGMGAVLYLGYTAGLVELAFLAPVLAAFQAVICWRAGRWYESRREGDGKGARE